MATAKLAVLCFVISFLSISLLLAPVRADVDVDSADSGLRIEVDALKSKIRALESSVEEKSKALKRKEETLGLKERTLKDKADKVESLQSELSALQKTGKLDAAVEIGKDYALTEELEKQVEKLNGKIEVQIKKNEALENHLSELEKRISVLVMKHDKLEKTIEEQKSKIRKTECALKVAEEELMKAKLEASTEIKVLTEVPAAWLPPWLASHWSQCQAFVEMHWNEHGKPATNLIIQKAIEKKDQVQEWAAPHVEKMKTEYLPAIRQQSLAIKASLEPQVQSLTAKAVEIYDTSRKAVTPRVIKVQEVVDPYYQEARKFSKPYIDQVATLSKPHIDKLRLTTKPFTKKVVDAYGKFLQSATSHHHQEYLPAIRQQSLAIKASLEPQVQSLTAKAVEIYDTSRKAVTPRVIKVQEVVDPYYQEARKFSKPYIDQVATLSKPHIDKLRLTTKPFTKKVVDAYGKFLQSATSHHHQVSVSSCIVTYAIEKKDQVEEWATPHVEKMKTEYLPAIRQQSLAIKASLEPQVQSLTAKAVEIYDTSRKAVTPRVIKVQEVVDPYYQEAWKFSKPYIDQVATLSKPHIDKLRLTTKPFTKKVVDAYGKFLQSASSHHHLVSVSSCIVTAGSAFWILLCFTLLMMIFNLMPEVAVCFLFF